MPQIAKQLSRVLHKQLWVPQPPIHDTGMEFSKAITVLIESQHHIHENIKFADQKALGIITINTALLAICFSLVTDQTTCGRGLGLLLSSAALCVGIFLGIMVIVPRGRQSRKRKAGLVDPDRIFQHDESRFLTQWHIASESRILDEMCTHVYDRSLVNAKKYDWLLYCIIFSACGWGVAVAMTAYVKLPATIQANLAAYTKAFTLFHVLCGQ